MKTNLITPYLRKKLEKEQRIYEEYNRLMSQPGAMAGVVRGILMEKYDIASQSTIWHICRRVEKRLRTQPK